jgi:hypothetical protein
MPVTVAKQLGPLTVRFTFDNDQEARQFADPARCALRDAGIKLTNARKRAADAAIVFARAGFNGLTAEFLELMRMYFCLPFPKNDAEAFTYKQALARIQECLDVAGGAFPADGLEIGQLDKGDCSKGDKGLVPNTVAEGIKAYLTPNTRAFVGTTPLEANILVNFRLLASNHWLVVNTMVNEATHQFAGTWDHAYFGAGGARINADTTWFTNCSMKLMLEDPEDDYFRATPLRGWNRDQALARLDRALKASNARKPEGKRLSPDELAKQFRATQKVIHQGAPASGVSAFTTEKVKALTPTKALNNADSFSCYVVDMPDSCLA